MSAFDGFPTLDALGSELARLAEAETQRAQRRRSWLRLPVRRRSLVLALAVALALAAGAAAATLLILRGAIIPAPSVIDVGRAEVPVPSSAKLIGLVSADPSRGAPWTMRVARSETGLVCSTVGQLKAGTFGLIGLDGRFRQIAVGLVDGCGQRQTNATTLLGARVFDARRRTDVRTVVNGVAGDTVRQVTVQAGGTVYHPLIGPGGTYVLALRGYPEDLGIVVDLRFADGHTEHHPLGTSAFVVTDPAEGPAWTTLAFVQDHSPLCIDVRPVRQTSATIPISPAACGHQTTSRHVFFAVRRLVPTATSCQTRPNILFTGRWCDAPARTVVWGAVGGLVRSVEITAAGTTRQVVISPSRTFLAVFPPTVDPDQIAVTVHANDGSVRRYTGDTDLLPGLRHQ
jgi:hypothetical protein